MKYTGAEVKSGILITTAIVLLILLTFIVGSFLTGETTTWQVRYGYVSGLEESAPVYYAGREVGKVDKIEVIPGKEKPIVVTIKVSLAVLLRENSQAFIDTLGMMGEKFIELSPGTEDSPFIRTGTMIEGVDPIAMHVMIRKMNLLADRMDEMTELLNPMIADVQIFMEETIQPVLMQTQTTLQTADKTLVNLNDILETNSEDVAKTIANLHQTSANIRDMTHDLKFRPWRILRRD